jgi:tetratricopeptide (TPR) repeat protein
MESLPLDTKVSAKRGTTSHDCPEWDCPTPMKYFKTDLPSEVKHPLRFRNKEEDDLEYFRTDQPSEVGKHPLRLRNKEEDGLLQAQAIPDAGVEHFPRDSEESILKMALELQNIAAGYREEGKLDEAMKALEEALELQRRVHGEGHPDVAMLLSSMGELLNEQGKLKEVCDEIYICIREGMIEFDQSPSTSVMSVDTALPHTHSPTPISVRLMPTSWFLLFQIL